MELVHVSVIHCRLLLHVLAAPKTLVEFQESQSLPLFFCGGSCQLPLGEVTVESGWNFEDHIRFLSCQLFGTVNHGHNWKGWERSGDQKA